MKNPVLILCLLMASVFTMSSCEKKEHMTPGGNANSASYSPSAIALEEGCDVGEEEDPVPMLAGTVKDSSNQLLSRACIELRNSLHQTLMITGSSSSGHYFFNSLNNGSYYLVVSKAGRPTKIVSFAVTSGAAQIIDVTL